MRKLLLVLIAAAISFTGAAQIYNPSLHTVTNKAIGIAQANPTDARSFYYDQTLFKYRPYQSTGEVLTYLNLQKYRFGNFPVYINLSGTLQPDGSYTDSTITEYWFKDCVADACLVLKTSGGGGSGTVTDVSAMWGMQTFPAIGITVSGTVNVDSGLVTSKAWLYKVADSLGALIGTGGSLRTIYVTQRGDAGDTVITALNDSTLWSSRLRDSTGIAIDRASDGALVIRSTVSTEASTPSTRVLNGLGCTRFLQTFPLELSSSAVVKSGSDNQINFIAIDVPYDTTITGVYYYLQTQGVFTADNFNGFALFSYSGGTLTQVAITANDGTFFSATAGGKNAAFTTPYVASPGTYYVAWLYCQSAQTTAPGLASKTATAIFSTLFTNSANLNMFWNGQTAMPASVATTSLTGGTGGSTWIGLY